MASRQKKKRDQLSARERQVMDVVYLLGEATATEVLEALSDPPSRNAVRTFLRILEEKGHLKHKQRGREYTRPPSSPTGRSSPTTLMAFSPPTTRVQESAIGESTFRVALRSRTSSTG